ncbi:host attachment protein [Aquamicrobium terrae]|uniref:Protein required for attachment to host cells n=1 Tax=Aquamicrobium terrae TaxID=1324945 RepID=A0ABV2N1F9_9HYPH
MILPHDAIVAVVDGEKLRLFRNRAPAPNIRLVELDVPEIDAVNQGSGMRHRSVAANPDEARLREDDFAAAVAGFLNRMALEGRIGALYVVADPRSLGELRRHYHDETRSRLAGEMARDLTGHTVEAIEAALAKE